MRRGHRLHSVHGAEPDMAGLARLPSVHRCLMVRVVVLVGPQVHFFKNIQHGVVFF